MRITVSQLRRIIKEEVARASRPRRSLREGGRGDEMVQIKNKYTGEPEMIRRSDLPKNHPEYAPPVGSKRPKRGTPERAVDDAYHNWWEDLADENPTAEDLVDYIDDRLGLDAAKITDLVAGPLAKHGYKLKTDKNGVEVIIGPELYN